MNKNDQFLNLKQHITKEVEKNRTMDYLYYFYFYYIIFQISI